MAAEAEAGAGIAAPATPEPTPTRVENPENRTNNRKREAFHVGRTIVGRPAREIRTLHKDKNTVPKDRNESALYLYGSIAEIESPKDDTKGEINDKKGIPLKGENPLFVTVGPDGQYVPATKADRNAITVNTITYIQKDGDVDILVCMVPDGKGGETEALIPRQALLDAFVLSEEAAFLAQYSKPEQAAQKKAAELYIQALKDNGQSLSESNDITIVEAAKKTGITAAETMRSFIGHALPGEAQNDKRTELLARLEDKQIVTAQETAELVIEIGANPAALAKSAQESTIRLRTLTDEIAKKRAEFTAFAQQDPSNPTLKSLSQEVATLQNTLDQEKLNATLSQELAEKLTPEFLADNNNPITSFFTQMEQGAYPEATVEQINTLMETGKSDKLLPAIVDALHKNGKLTDEEKKRFLTTDMKLNAILGLLTLILGLNEKMKSRPEG